MQSVLVDMDASFMQIIHSRFLVVQQRYYSGLTRALVQRQNVVGKAGTGSIKFFPKPKYQSVLRRRYFCPRLPWHDPSPNLVPGTHPHLRIRSRYRAEGQTPTLFLQSPLLQWFEGNRLFACGHANRHRCFHLDFRQTESEECSSPQCPHLIALRNTTKTHPILATCGCSSRSDKNR